MANEKILDRLYEKVSAEHDAYRNELLLRSPEDILAAAFEYTFRDIVVSLLKNEDDLLTNEQAECLLSMDRPCEVIFDFYQRSDLGDLGPIRGTIRSAAFYNMR